MLSRYRLSILAVTFFLSLAGAVQASPAAPAGTAASVPTEAAPAAVKAASADAASVEVPAVENPYGLSALWNGSDAVAKGTLLILLLFSIGSWYIIVAKLLAQRKLHKQARDTQRTFWDAGSVRQGLDTLESGTPFHFIGSVALKATEHHSGLLEHVDLNTWVVQALHSSVDTVKSRLQDGLAFLATVGSTAPFIGLFGTVWGIYHALTAIGLSGQASIDKVAGPVGEALIMTAIGLAVAVPAVLGYNLLVRRNKAALERVQDFSTTLHAVLLSTTTTSSPAAALKAA
ncbi:MotA/TolQ/ExbB proton channel family protein [Oxalicibacterium flavum]|uniref:MotA/TolQ/ExbB proton channel family protein n=1 Tax=Oxalicibacterium flavum TaxID=179467 RepID=UPI0016640F91|nr:MotA/TolQ/ExbB proton channel family protein [Oxalicibacterium flavum]